MSDDLRERVARAIAESDGYDHLQDWQDKLSECQRQDYLANADAALAEMGVLQNQLDEAINQLDSARHSVDVLERRIAELLQK